MSLSGVVRYRATPDAPWQETGYSGTAMARIISAGYEYQLQGRDYGLPVPVTPVEDDGLTLATDPVTRWALNAFAVFVGAGIVAALAAWMPL